MGSFLDTLEDVDHVRAIEKAGLHRIPPISVVGFNVVCTGPESQHVLRQEVGRGSKNHESSIGEGCRP